MNRYNLTDNDLLYMYAHIGITHYHSLSKKTQREKLEWLECMIRKLLVESADLKFLLEELENYSKRDYEAFMHEWIYLKVKGLKEKYEK